MVTTERSMSALTPELIERTVHAMVAERDPGARGAVAIGALARRLVADGALRLDLTDSLVAELVAHRIARQVAVIEGLTFVENE